MNNLIRRIITLYRRVLTTILLIILITMIIIKGHNFQVGRIYRRSLKFIEAAVRDRKLHR